MERGRVLEELKTDNGISNDAHGQIMNNGDFVVNGNTIGNIGEYVDERHRRRQNSIADDTAERCLPNMWGKGVRKGSR